MQPVVTLDFRACRYTYIVQPSLTFLPTPSYLQDSQEQGGYREDGGSVWFWGAPHPVRPLSRAPARPTELSSRDTPSPISRLKHTEEDEGEDIFLSVLSSQHRNMDLIKPVSVEPVFYIALVSTLTPVLGDRRKGQKEKTFM